MADANPPVDAGVNPQGSDEQPVDTNDNLGSSNQPQGPSEAERKLQSERDKLRAEMEQLQGYQAQQMFEKAASSYLKDKASDYPDVEVEDLSTAISEDDFEKLAKKAQDRMDRVRNKALADVHNVPDDSLTPEQAEAELNKLEEKPDPQGFQKYLNVLQRTRK